MGERVFLKFLAFLRIVESLRIASSISADPTLGGSFSPTDIVTLVWLPGKRFFRVCNPKPPEGTLPEGPSELLQPFLDDVEELREPRLRLQLCVLHYVAQEVG